ncbi:MAG: fibrobacter succinogenes major paralogous domain-containing protein [Bacteroidales bacterium]
MKTLGRFLLILLFSVVTGLAVHAQYGINYQAVIRDTDGKALPSQNAVIRVKLTNSDGSIVYYSEDRGVTTNGFGLVTFVIGSEGADNIIGVFNDVPWKSGSVYLSVDLQLSGASSFTSFERQKLQAVPYALFAANVLNIEWQGSLAIAPASPEKNFAYYNTVDKKSYIYDGDSWEVLAQDGTIGEAGTSVNWVGTLDVAPTPTLNMAYYNSVDKVAYIWDGDSWETLAKDGATGNDGISINWVGSLNTAPEPALNKGYYNTVDKKSYIYDGDSWEIFAQDGEQGPVGPLVDGAKGQTLSHNGTSWVANGTIMVTDSSVNIVPKAGHNVEQPIFSVLNSSGQTVFAVYESGVRSYVGSDGTKGAKGGFAVGGLSTQSKGTSVEYLKVSPDSVRIYIDNTTTSIKGAKGGFAVGGISTQGKAVVSEYLRITADSTRIYINDSSKGAKGGFAVGGLSTQSKGSSGNYFKVTPDSTYFANTILSEGDMLVAGNVSSNVGIEETALTDVDGNVYKTIKIGTQVWMAENLKTTKLSDGTAIPTDSVLVYNNSTDADTLSAFGRLYAYGLIELSYSVCPTGWHVPTTLDWQTLFSFVGGIYYQTNSSVVGTKLAEVGYVEDGTGYWYNQGTFYPTNSTGFTARPGGSADYSSMWGSYGMGYNANFWSNNTTYPEVIQIDGYSGNANVTEGSSIGAYSIRCIKD